MVVPVGIAGASHTNKVLFTARQSDCGIEISMIMDDDNNHKFCKISEDKLRILHHIHVDNKKCKCHSYTAPCTSTKMKHECTLYQNIRP